MHDTFTSSSTTSTTRPLFDDSIIRPSGVNCVYAFGRDAWFGMVNIRIHRPRMRSAFTALKDCEPPLTYVGGDGA